MSVHFSSKSPDWTTPLDLFNKLNSIYSFDLDAAASEENALCNFFYTIEDSGLEHSWAGRRVWCNPPYGRTIRAWTRKAAAESLQATLIVMLVPARTDTIWWHEAVQTARVVYLKGRLKFGGQKNAAPFPSALLIWDGLR